ncbi:MAG TPA: nucleoside-diphosphate sugar epimerase/dehydratase [Gemmatimonadales bacterium]|nr:nucleoside-diphosphate sugar epimerase/dehydratase [Gemmatimonadales bacterium]
MPNIRNRYLFLSDLALLAAAPWLAYAIRFEGLGWRPADARTAAVYAGASLLVKLVVFLSFGMYGRLWRHASVPDLTKIIEATVVATSASALLGLIGLPASGLTLVRVPMSVAMLDAFLTITVVAAPRLLVRTLANGQRRAGRAGKRVLIVGAGAAGEMILRELLANPQLALEPVGFVDDDPRKHNTRLNDVPVLGALSETRTLIEQHRIEEILIAMPAAPGGVVRGVVRAAMEARIPARTVPALSEILSGRVSMSHLRKVEIQDLLRREPVRTDLQPVRAIVAGRTVLVTGAGGSIGSELARQLAWLKPAHLVLLGNGENEIFDIREELNGAFPALRITAVIADIRDRLRMRTVFGRVRPDAVFHAAAHKHVPLMEDNVSDSVTNNVLGTKNVVDCAVEVDTRHFVLISTDKAVRPTSVMGATKRVAEMVVQEAAVRTGRNFVSVRFGNVLGSRCSVVPIFLAQIRAGGPVTVTHPDMHRYFMTIPEAVQLVLQASALGSGGEVFVLDMGNPIRIADLATDLIRLSGLEVGKDIEIRYTGIRPGERLHEEPFFLHEEVLATRHSKILRATNNHLPEEVGESVALLVEAARACRAEEELRYQLRTLVPDFHTDASTKPPAPVRSPWPTSITSKAGVAASTGR